MFIGLILFLGIELLLNVNGHLHLMERTLKEFDFVASERGFVVNGLFEWERDGEFW
jgi:hypothetical protein